jgi:hypothetical protein
LAKQAPSNKHQITNKYEEPKLEIQNERCAGLGGSAHLNLWLGIRLMLVACDLVL